jgi:hypothetical protein
MLIRLVDGGGLSLGAKIRERAFRAVVKLLLLAVTRLQGG